MLIRDGPVRYDVARGDNVTLMCDVVGSPDPEVVWIHNAAFLTSNGDKYVIGEDDSLLVKSVTEKDEGDYVCIARNRVNSASKTLMLSIRGMKDYCFLRCL